MVTRVSGFASGMDIDSIVSDMLKAQRAPLNKLLQKKQILEWQRDDYRAMNTALLNFRTNELTSMRLTTNYRTKTVSSSDGSKVTATATSAANQASYNISEVGQLATAYVRQNSAAVNKSNATVDASKSLYSQRASFNNQNFGWQDGAVLTKSMKTDNIRSSTDKNVLENVFSTEEINNIKKTSAGEWVTGDWSVKINGKSYRVITTGEPAENQVLINTTNGNLTFKNEVAENSDIRIDYIGKSKTETVSVSANKTVQLSEVGLSFENIKALSFTATQKDGSKETQTYKVEDDTDDSAYVNILDTEDKTIGKVHKEMGVLTFTSEALTSNESTSYSLDVNYSHKYTIFSMSTNTSSGTQYEKFIATGADSINDVARQVNDSKVGVSLFYDSFSNKMTLTRKETGKYSESGNDLTVYGNLMNNVFKFASAVGEDGESLIKSGENSSFTINGLKTERNSNTFTIDGVTFTLKQTFEATNSTVTIGVSNDNTKIYENIKGFIDKYNELIETIQAKTNETRNKDYQPLTDDERESLSDKQQEKWEEIAKAGLLRRDSILTGILSQMRTNFYSTVNNSEISANYNQLAKIGITTSANYLEGGKLVIDEAKLKAAIEADPNSVEQLFRGENGIIQKLTDTVNGAMDKLKTKAGNPFSTNDNFTIGKELNNIAKRQESFEDRLEQLETRYWAQFTAMEQAIQKANSQSSSLSQYFSY